MLMYYYYFLFTVHKSLWPIVSGSFQLILCTLLNLRCGWMSRLGKIGQTCSSNHILTWCNKNKNKRFINIVQKNGALKGTETWLILQKNSNYLWQIQIIYAYSKYVHKYIYIYIMNECGWPNNGYQMEWIGDLYVYSVYTQRKLH